MLSTQYLLKSLYSAPKSYKDEYFLVWNVKKFQEIGLIWLKEEGRTGFSEGWQGCSERFPQGEARGKFRGAALPARGKPCPSLLLYSDYHSISNRVFQSTEVCRQVNKKGILEMWGLGILQRDLWLRQRGNVHQARQTMGEQSVHNNGRCKTWHSLNSLEC